VSRFRTGCIAAALLLAASPADAATLYSNDFSTDAAGFSGGAVETAPSGERFLAGFSFAGTRLTLTGLAPGSAVNLAFTLYAIGCPDGDGTACLCGPDVFNVMSNGATVFHFTFANFFGESQSYPTEPSPAHSGAAIVGTLDYTGVTTGGDVTYNLAVSSTADALGRSSSPFTTPRTRACQTNSTASTTSS
jgi:hypothetical protein